MAEILDQGAENGLEEAAVRGQGGAVVGREGGFDGLLTNGSDEQGLKSIDRGSLCRS